MRGPGSYDQPIINNGNSFAKLLRFLNVMGSEENCFPLPEPNGDLNLDPWTFQAHDDKIHVDTNHPEKDMARIISLIVQQGFTVENVCICRSSLEDVFVKLTGKSLLVESDTPESIEEALDV